MNNSLVTLAVLAGAWYVLTTEPQQAASASAPPSTPPSQPSGGSSGGGSGGTDWGSVAEAGFALVGQIVDAATRNRDAGGV